MRKIVFSFLMITICFSLFAMTVSVYPSDENLEKQLKKYYPSVELKKLDAVVDSSLILKHDPRLMEMLSKKAGSDILIFPMYESMSDFSHITVYVFDSRSGDFFKLYEELYQGTLNYPDETMRSLSYLFMEDNSFDFDAVKALEINELNSFKSIMENSSQYLHDSKAYKEARNKFYGSFAKTLGVFGLNVLVNSLSINNTSVQRALDIGTKVGIGVSGYYLLKDLRNYTRNAEYIVP